ncbi:MAG: hypothetical protein VX694_00490 [Planctomycetota bacterium]|nr:hypothetical protein [Planctomycetota bacterium]
MRDRDTANTTRNKSPFASSLPLRQRKKLWHNDAAALYSVAANMARPKKVRRMMHMTCDRAYDLDSITKKINQNSKCHQFDTRLLRRVSIHFIIAKNWFAKSITD